MLKASQNLSSIEYTDSSQFNLHMAPTTGQGDDFLPPNTRTMDAEMAPFPDSFESNFLGSLSGPHLSTRGNQITFAVDTVIPEEGTNNNTNGTNSTSSTNGTTIDTSDTNSSTGGSPSNTKSNNNIPISSRHQQQRPKRQGKGSSPRLHIPSLREIRALNSPSAVISSSPPPFSSAKSEDDSRRITNEFATFCATMFVMHAEMAGVTSVVGEYLNSIRKSRAAEVDSNCATVLETLECRVRELQEMAETRPRDAWVTLLETLKTGHFDQHLFTMMRSFEMEAEERVRKTRLFFQESYDVSLRLSEQMRDEQTKE
ncbi:hypothetical protein MGU_10698 [Metarhizium guizhouense ARSEF 977]|uniref:Uncharacterized protein n=1 Tax=Metarhizium guizhouense (strain ARSEF 977) TaxID=1276136 RepID=A0A0B4GWT6_METGA|nr:hypothetical protein MGU_10698 [Metarhizium guizhouense ARSEF 977]